jgi:hypothetical protein
VAKIFTLVTFFEKNFVKSEPPVLLFLEESVLLVEECDGGAIFESAEGIKDTENVDFGCKHEYSSEVEITITTTDYIFFNIG